MRVFINRTEVKIDYTAAPLNIGSTDLQSPISVASFLYETAQNPSLSLVPKEGDLVEITDHAGLYPFYFGHIAQVDRGDDPVTPRYAISCQDLSAELEKIRLPSDWIVPAGFGDAWLVDRLLGSFGGNDASATCVWPSVLQTPLLLVHLILPNWYISKATSLPGFTLRAGSSVADGLRQISTLVGGAVWMIDEQAGFHWNDVGDLAPWVLTTENPDAWPTRANAFYGYHDFVDQTGRFFRVTVDNGAGITATVTDWPVYGLSHGIDSVVPISSSYHGWFNTTGNELYEDGSPVSDSGLATQAAVTQRAYAELNRGRARRTIRLSLQRSLSGGPAPLRAGMLVDVVHRVYGGRDLIPVPHVTREVGIHSNIRGELVPYSRGRFLIQRVTPTVLLSTSVTDVIRYDLEMGDYEDGLAATLAKVV